MNKVTGSCLCGANRFEVEGEFESFFLCHCSRCRKDTGSAHGANLFSTTARLRWLSDGTAVSRYKLPGTEHARNFCSTCGSALPSEQMDGKLLVVPAGSLDSEFSMRPTAHLFVSSKAAWDHDLETIPQMEKLPQGE
ncbi:MAG: GFA family protein [Chrysiogenetes bacterium]|nr:GFA family protein [Chrysiogenetes bacterium]